MELFTTFPSVRDGTLSDNVEKFARDLAERLEKFNEEHPRPEMGDDAWKRFREKHGENIPRPTPHDLIPTFRIVFGLYMSSRYGIVP